MVEREKRVYIMYLAGTSFRRCSARKASLSKISSKLAREHLMHAREVNSKRPKVLPFKGEREVHKRTKWMRVVMGYIVEERENVVHMLRGSGG